MYSLVLLAALVNAPTGLMLEAQTPQTTVLVGEPLKVIVTWRAIGRRVERIFPETEDFATQSVSFVIDDGRSKYEYRETARGGVERVDPVVVLSEGQEVTRTLVLIHGAYSAARGAAQGPPLRKSGHYRLKVSYDRQGQRADSNSIAVRVEEPPHADRDVLAAALQEPSILHTGRTEAAQDLTRRLIATHPDSPYLKFARLSLLESHALALHNGQDPVTRQPLADSGTPAMRTAQLAGYRRLAEQILADSSWGPFEEEALGLALRCAQAAGARDVAEQVRGVIAIKYPASGGLR